MSEHRVTVLVRGVGDIGSAVAHRLVTEGYGVIMHDVPLPTTTRRKMAFADAVFGGVASLQGVAAERAADVAHGRELMRRRVVAVYVGDFQLLVEGLTPAVLVDARMRKRAVAEDQRGLAALVIGLGPNFKVGHTCHVAVETSWDGVGAVIRDGEPLPLQGEPRELGGHARDRYVYAPCSGMFRTQRNIGDVITEAQEIAVIEGTTLRAPLSGVLRGLTHDSVPVLEGTKVIEVDPRGRTGEVAGIAERPRRIAHGVVAAIREDDRRA